MRTQKLADFLHEFTGYFCPRGLSQSAALPAMADAKARYNQPRLPTVCPLSTLGVAGWTVVSCLALQPHSTRSTPTYFLAAGSLTNHNGGSRSCCLPSHVFSARHTLSKVHRVAETRCSKALGEPPLLAPAGPLYATSVPGGLD